jgi:hypothetical protein
MKLLRVEKEATRARFLNVALRERVCDGWVSVEGQQGFGVRAARRS